MIRLPTFVTLIWMATSFSAAAPESSPLTLAQAQRLLLTGSPDMRLERLSAEKADAQVSEARAAYWPSLDVSGSYQAMTEKNRISITLPPPSGATIDRTMGDYDREEYGIDLTVPLFAGGARRQQVLARQSSQRAVTAGSRAQENALSLRLAALYCAWQAADSAARSQAQIVALYRDFAEHVNQQVKNGAALRSQSAAARARWLNAESERLGAQDTRDSLGRAASLLLGRSPDEPVMFVTASPSAPGSVPETKAGDPDRPDLLVLDHSMESLEHQQRGLKGQRFPVVTGLVGYRLANPGLNLGTNDYMNYGVLGVQAKWNLFDGFRNRSQRTQLQTQEASLRVEKDRRTAAWTEAERSASSRLARLEVSLQAAQAAWESADESRREKEAQRAQGAATELEVLDARAQTVRAALQIQSLEWQRALAAWQSKYANGETLTFPEGG